MKSIYIFDEFISSSINGIGTYLNEFLSIFENSNYILNVIRFNFKADEFSIMYDSPVRYYNIPIFPDKSFFKHHSIITKLLYLHIKDSLDNIFIINHTPCENLIESIKGYFPKSKIVLIIHGQDWCAELSGNTQLLYKIIEDSLNKDQNIIYKDVISGFRREERMYQLADHIICLSEDTLNILTDLYHVPLLKVTLIYNGLRDIDNYNMLKCNNQIRKEYMISKEESIIIYAGRINREKGVYDLVSAMENVCLSNYNVRLLIAGQLPNPDIIQHSSKLCCKISFCGHLQKDHLFKLYSIANIGVLPSYIEQCSYTGIEMLMHGLPIVTTDGLGNRNMFYHNYNALISKLEYTTEKKYFIESLSNNILSLIENSELCKRLSIGARKTYLDKYRISRMKENYLNAFESL